MRNDLFNTGKQESLKCPFCGSENLARIIYGLPNFNEKMKKDIDKGKIILGGCCISDFDPHWHCNNCKRYFNFGEENGYN
ncbi:MAG: hypothetical protein N2510_01680 [Ignavibacteria bacterium]|nr:hypothetical protein [Ignavibacteria bacterium]